MAMFAMQLPMSQQGTLRLGNHRLRLLIAFALVSLASGVRTANSKAGKQQPDPQVLIVNDIPGHQEVLAGVMHVLRASKVPFTTLYTGSQLMFQTLGYFQWLNYSDAQVNATVPKTLRKAPIKNFKYAVPDMGVFHHIAAGPVKLPEGLAADLLVCISPELSPLLCSRVVQAVKPALLITFVHRAEQINKIVSTMQQRQLLVALSPHVANYAAEVVGYSVGWLLPVAPFNNSGRPCLSLDCLDGFVIQGSIRTAPTKNIGGGTLTRNYGALWDRLVALQRVDQVVVPQFNVTVLGRGNGAYLGVPNELASNVSHFENLPYAEFWGRIHHSLALLPCFGTESYYTSRLSSTIIASLITATPMIADWRLLASYPFLTEEHVFLQEPGEDEAAAMMRVKRMNATEVFSRRQALERLREHLNFRSRTVIRRWLGIARNLTSPDPAIANNVRVRRAAYF